MNNNTYIELLKQYQAGTISESDRHILERAALDDPFLFDAMEGYGVSGSSVDTQVIKALKKSKTDNHGKVKWFNMRTLSVAASLVALVAITFLVKHQLSESSNISTAVASNDKIEETVPMAQTWSNEKDEEVAIEESTTDPIEEMDEVKDEVEEEEMDFVATEVDNVNANGSVLGDANSESNIPSPPQAATKDINPDYQVVEGEISEAEIAPEVMEQKSNEKEADMEMNNASLTKSKSAQKKKYSKPEEDAISYAETDGKGGYILGKVLDTEGNHLIGATVYIENTEIGDVTDIDGNFKLPKYESGHQMVANYTGYKTQKIILGDIDFYQIVMSVSDVPLSEVVVTLPKIVDKNKAFPAMSMEDFEVYVSENKKYPLEVFGTTKSGTFKVSFTVNMDGSLSNFVDESKNCDDCFKEAVRLLKGSGKWDTKPAGQLYRTSYLFEF